MHEDGMTWQYKSYQVNKIRSVTVYTNTKIYHAHDKSRFWQKKHELSDTSLIFETSPWQTKEYHVGLQ